MRFVYLLIFVFLVACATTSPIRTKEINGLVDDLMQMSKDLNIQEQIDPIPKTTQFLAFEEKSIYLIVPQGLPDFTATVYQKYIRVSDNLGFIVYYYEDKIYYFYVCSEKGVIIGLRVGKQFWEYEGLNPIPVTEDAFLYILDLAEVYCGEGGGV